MIDYRNNGFQNKGGDLDITNKCTLQCPTCSRGKFNYKSNDIPGGDLTIEEWQDLTDYFSTLTLNGTYGDPVFNPNLASEQARFTAIVLFPTPPLPLLTAMIFRIPSIFCNSGALL